MPKNHANTHITTSDAPTITATPAHVVTGAGFLPDHEVTIRVTHAEDDVSDYLTDATDAAGRLFAAIPANVDTGTAHITVTDHRRDPDSAGGLLWSNTRTLPG
jgi:hypothetical protein